MPAHVCEYSASGFGSATAQVSEKLCRQLASSGPCKGERKQRLSPTQATTLGTAEANEGGAMGQDLIQHTSSIAYDRVGNGSPIVFVHGLTYDRRLWAPVVERLRDEYACVNIDLPGHGASLDAQTYDLDVVADNIHELIDRLELANPVMVGHSISGLIVGFYASLYPTAGIVTSDQTLRTTPFAERLWGMREQLQSPAFPGIWRAIESQLGIDLIAERYRPGRKSLEPAARGRAWLLRTIFEVAPAELQERLVEIIGKIDVPFTAIFGEEVDPDYCGWLTALVPQCELVVFPNAGHFPHLVDSDRFSDEVRAVERKAFRT